MCVQMMMVLKCVCVCVCSGDNGTKEAENYPGDSWVVVLRI